MKPQGIWSNPFYSRLWLHIDQKIRRFKVPAYDTLVAPHVSPGKCFWRHKYVNPLVHRNVSAFLQVSVIHNTEIAVYPETKFAEIRGHDFPFKVRKFGYPCILCIFIHTYNDNTCCIIQIVLKIPEKWTSLWMAITDNCHP